MGHIKFFDLQAEPVKDPNGGYVNYPSQIAVDTNPKFRHLLSAHELIMLNQADELATLRAQNAELREALTQLIKRASQIDNRLLAITGNTADCEIGEITRARAILTKYGDDNA